MAVGGRAKRGVEEAGRNEAFKVCELSASRLLSARARAALLAPRPWHAAHFVRASVACAAPDSLLEGQLERSARTTSIHWCESWTLDTARTLARGTLGNSV